MWFFLQEWCVSLEYTCQMVSSEMFAHTLQNLQTLWIQEQWVLEAVLTWLCWDESNPATVCSCLLVALPIASTRHVLELHDVLKHTKTSLRDWCTRVLLSGSNPRFFRIQLIILSWIPEIFVALGVRLSGEPSMWNPLAKQVCSRKLAGCLFFQIYHCYIINLREHPMTWTERTEFTSSFWVISHSSSQESALWVVMFCLVLGPWPVALLNEPICFMYESLTTIYQHADTCASHWNVG